MSDFIERLEVEKNELGDKLKKLSDFIINDKFTEVSEGATEATA